MGGKMHRKTDSEVTTNSMEQSSSSPNRSPPRRPLYYVQSPSNHDVEKMSYGSSPINSPPHQNFHYYLSSPIHHSRESSTSRYSASLKNPRNISTSSWKKLHNRNVHDDLDEDEGEDDDGVYDSTRNVRLGFCFLVMFVLLFSVFSLILWGASKSFKPRVIVKSIVFENLNVQSGNDATGVPTDMLSVNSTVRILYRNPATFFGVHVTSTPLLLSYFQLTLASGQIPEFYQSRKSQRKLAVVVSGYQVPLYGGVSVLGNGNTEHMNSLALPMNLTFVVRSRAYILGRLVKSKFYRRIRCSVNLHGNKLGKHLNMTDSCVYK